MKFSRSPTLSLRQTYIHNFITKVITKWPCRTITSQPKSSSYLLHYWPLFLSQTSSAPQHARVGWLFLLLCHFSPVTSLGINWHPQRQFLKGSLHNFYTAAQQDRKTQPSRTIVLDSTRCNVWDNFILISLCIIFFQCHHMSFCGLLSPPSWAWQECNRLLRLGRPWGAVTLSRWCVSGDRGGCSVRRGLKPKFY
jgi:hypothetical protein